MELGKTTLCEIIKEKYNSKIIDADKIAKKLSNDTSSKYYEKMAELFGKESILEDGSLDRKKIAQIIYKDEDKRLALNNLTFKFVVDEIKEEVKKSNDKDYVVIDAPLLFEANLEKICDKVIAVIAIDENKIDRICKRDNIEKEVALKRLSIQNNDEYYIRKADFVIYNDKDVENLEKSFEKILEEI